MKCNRCGNPLKPISSRDGITIEICMICGREKGHDYDVPMLVVDHREVRVND